jgi:putative transposase
VWRELLRAGEDVGRDRVARLMRRAGIQGAKRRGKPWRTTKPNPDAQRRPDLVNREFTAERPNELWVDDLTYLRCWEGVSYLAFIIDVFSRMVVGWQFASHMRTDLVLDALRMAIGLRGAGADLALVHHSDQGSQPGLNRSSQRWVSWGDCRWVTRLSSWRRERSECRSGDSRVRVVVGGGHAAGRR